MAWTPERRPALLAVAALVLALAALAIAIWPSSPGKVGPLGYEPGSVSMGGSVRANARWLHFTDILENQGQTEVTLKDFQLIDPSPGLKLARVLVADPNPPIRSLSALGDGFSLPRFRRAGYADAPGKVIAPQEWFVRGAATYELAFGLRVDQPGYYSFKGYTVSYLADGDERSEEAGPEVYFCVGTTRPPKGCHPPAA